MPRRPSRRNASPRLRNRLRCEVLEDRRVLATYVVSSTADAGEGSLREAIGLANGTVGVADEIVFDETVFSTPQAILLDSQLPTITDSLAIVGPGAEFLTVDAQKELYDGSVRFGVLVVNNGSSSTTIEVSLAGLTFRNVSDRSAVVNAETLTVMDCVFADNGLRSSNQAQTPRGGAIDNSGSLSIVGSRFQRNHAVSGGAVYSNGTALSITACYFADNVSDTGGAVYSSGGTLSIAGSTFAKNVAGISGGAISINHGQGQALIIESTFSENEGNITGAILVGGWLEMRHSTVVGSRTRSATFSTSAIYSGVVNRVSIDHSIIAGSVRVNTNNSTTAIQDLLRITNVANSVVGYDAQGLADGENGNRIGGAGGTRIDPHLAPLAMNGGSMPTHAPLPGSLVIDAGDSDFVATPGEADQRGGAYERVAGERIDIGAFEAQGTVTAAAGDFNGDGRFDAADYTVWRDSFGISVAPLTAGDGTGDGIVDETDRQLWASRYGDRYVTKVQVNDLSDVDDGDIFNGATTLREAIRFANQTRWVNTITFDPSLSGGTIRIGSSIPNQLIGRDESGYNIYRDLTIDARGLADGITLDGEDRFRIFNVDQYYYDDQVPVGVEIDHEAIDLTLAGLTLTRGGGYAGAAFGRSGGAVRHASTGVLTLIETTIRDSRSTELGGAIWAGSIAFDYEIGGVVLIDSVVERTTATGSYNGLSGGGIFSTGKVSLLRSEIRETSGGGVVMYTYSILRPFNGKLIDAATVTLVDSSITGGAAGGGVFAYGDVSLLRSVVNDNIGYGVLARSYHDYPGSVTLTDSSVSGNRMNVNMNSGIQNLIGGAGITAQQDVTLVRSRVENNTIADPTAGAGGGIAAAGNVSLRDSYVRGNKAARGGGVYALGRTPGSTAPPAVGTMVVSVVGSEVSGNSSYVTAAAIYSLGSMEIRESTICDNVITIVSPFELTATVLNGSQNTGSLQFTSIVEDSVLSGNSGPASARVTNSYSGGASSVVRSQVIDNNISGATATTIVDSVISRNGGAGAFITSEVKGSTVADNQGYGVWGWGSTFVVNSSVIRGNHVGVYGESNSHIVLVNSTITQNVLAPPPSGFVYKGAGVYGYRISLYGSTVSDNVVVDDGAQGGGVYATDSINLVQSTVSGNRVEGDGALGGGIYTKHLAAMHSTVANNSADSLGGGVYATGNVTLEGTILAGNSAVVDGPDLYRLGTGSLTVKYSLLSDAAGSGIDSSTGNGNLLNVDPLLGPLQDNGGPTWTHALLTGSPAIDAGDPTRATVPWSVPASGAFPGASFTGNVDQRGAGFARRLDGGTGVLRIDMGALEAGAPIAPAFVWTPSLISIEPMVTTNEPSLSLPESYDIALAELSAWRASLLNELERPSALNSNDAAPFELLEDLIAKDYSQEAIDDAVKAEFSS